MNLRDRIVGLRRVPARLLATNPRNWRSHPERQRMAMRDLLDDVGFADALLARQASDGSLELIDGHLRADMAGDDVVPVLVLDVTETEANKLLAVLDPLTQMADTDRSKITALLQECGEQAGVLEELRQELARKAGACQEEQTSGDSLAMEVDVDSFRMSHRCKECGLEFNS